MNTKRFCDLAHVSHGTFRNWTATFAPFLSPQASPTKGKPRVLSDHDQRVLYLVSMLRETGLGLDDITNRLKDLQRADWGGLPDIPDEWKQPGETISVGVAVSKAYDVAQIAVLQRDLEYTRTELESATRSLEAAQQRVSEIEVELSTVRDSERAVQAELRQELHTAQIELSQARGEVAELRARLSAYAITGGDKPIPVALIVAVTAVAALVFVLVVLVTARVLF